MPAGAAHAHHDQLGDHRHGLLARHARRDRLQPPSSRRRPRRAAPRASTRGPCGRSSSGRRRPGPAATASSSTGPAAGRRATLRTGARGRPRPGRPAPPTLRLPAASSWSAAPASSSTSGASACPARRGSWRSPPSSGSLRKRSPAPPTSPCRRTAGPSSCPSASASPMTRCGRGSRFAAASSPGRRDPSCVSRSRAGRRRSRSSPKASGASASPCPSR